MNLGLSNGKLRLLLGAVLMAAVVSVSAQSKPKMTPVYMFGFSASFADSVAFQTDIQRIDSAWIDSHKLLVDRSLYTLQLQYYVEGEEGTANTTCAVFFNTSKRKLQKTWNRVRKRYINAEGLRLRQLDTEHFRFHAEEYSPVIIGDVEPEPAPTTPPTQAAPPAVNQAP